MQKITKEDVSSYFQNKLTRDRRREIEEASLTDPEVKGWLDELTPTDEQLDQQPLPTVPALDSPEGRKLGAAALPSALNNEVSEGSVPVNIEGKEFLISKYDVLAYVAGAVSHPQLKAAIELARDTDSLIQYWFDIFNPDGEDEEVPQIFIDQAKEMLEDMSNKKNPPA